MARVYLHGSPGKRPDQIAQHTVTACPAGHLHGIEMPTEFFDVTGRDLKPREFVVTFRYGRSEEITTRLGRQRRFLILAPKIQTAAGLSRSRSPILCQSRQTDSTGWTSVKTNASRGESGRL